MLLLLQFSIAMVVRWIYFFAHGKQSELFQIVSKISDCFWNTLNFFDCWFDENSPFYFAPSIASIFVGKKKTKIEGPAW